MFVLFDDVDTKARIWTFLADRKLTVLEMDIIRDSSEAFIQQWTSHQQEVKGSFTILFDALWVIAADNDYAQVGGCSTDSLLRFVQDTQQRIGVNFFDRSKVLVKSSEEVILSSITKLASIENIENCTIFNPLVESKAALEASLFTPFVDSRYAVMV